MIVVRVTDESDFPSYIRKVEWSSSRMQVEIYWTIMEHETMMFSSEQEAGEFLRAVKPYWNRHLGKSRLELVEYTASDDTVVVEFGE